MTHYYDRIEVAVVEPSSKLKVGDNMSIEGPGVSFEQMENLKKKIWKSFIKLSKDILIIYHSRSATTLSGA